MQINAFPPAGPALWSGNGKQRQSRGRDDSGRGGQRTERSGLRRLTHVDADTPGSVGRRAEGTMVSRDLSLRGMKGSVLGWGRDMLEIDLGSHLGVVMAEAVSVDKETRGTLYGQLLRILKMSNSTTRYDSKKLILAKAREELVQSFAFFLLSDLIQQQLPPLFL